MPDLPTVPGLPELAADVAALEARVGELEAWRQAHTAGMFRRQQQIDNQRHVLARDRWLRSLRGRR